MRGTRAYVRSPLAYAPVHEFGGSIRPRGVPITIRESGFMARAIDRQADAFEETLAKGIDRLAERHGFH